jgi:hypothetical protein
MNQKASAHAARMEPYGPVKISGLSLKLNTKGLFALPPVKDLNHRLLDAQI